MRACFLLAALTALLAAMPAHGQESPYFVTYSHHLEEPGNLEIAAASTIGVPKGNERAYFAPWIELEYGVLGRWTSELYLEGQSTAGQSSIFTGWRWENRVRPLLREHLFNPVLYFEYEDINEADKIQKEIVGHAPDFSEPNSELRREHAREIEGKLILSSQARDWNIAENFVVEKNLSHDEGVEFGYALGVSRPLANLASPQRCVFCRENFAAGLELYGVAGRARKDAVEEHGIERRPLTGEGSGAENRDRRRDDRYQEDDQARRRVARAGSGRAAQRADVRARRGVLRR